MAYLVKTPSVIKPLASDLIFSLPSGEKTLFLTFDDGPTVGVTQKVLDILDEHQARATFFCIGGNVLAQSDIYTDILRRGHQTGNHTWNHMNGWEYSDFSYFRNITECSQIVDSTLFRPPYGRIKRSQARGLKKRYSIIMWDVLSADWHAAVSPEKCLQNVVKNAVDGSIIVFHDSVKASENMLFALPRVLSYFSEQGFRFKVLPQRIAAKEQKSALTTQD
jgi:peptidoglycan/xylan/chitin deacetylase (PgdA/CDA1 family)